MWLDELNGLVVKLNAKIDQHREIFQKSESATRYCLIDPLLTALGWSLSDPAQVLTEYKTGYGRADYAMVQRTGPPSLIVEAKSLFTPTESAIKQTIEYCHLEGIKYFAITNGDDWEIYETHKPVPMPEKRVTAFKITDKNQSTVMGMLWLWRGNFGSGEPVKPTCPSAEDSSFVTPPPPPPPPQGKPLSELTDVTGTAPPQLMAFRDGITKPVGKWNRIQIATVEWLVETNRLKDSSCPVTNPRGTHLVHTSPYRRDGKRFTEPRMIGPFSIDVCEDANGHVRRAKHILTAMKEDPATVHVTY